MSFHVKQLAIAGVGLIGGSLAAALKQAKVVDEIIGLGRRRETLERAKTLGLIDRIAEMPEQIADADVMLIATPVAQTAMVLQAIAPHIGKNTVITDAGSTKGDILAAAQKVLGNAASRFVAGHPIAGAESNGPEAARADLFNRKHVVLCPAANTQPNAVEQVAALWQAAGAKVVRMQAARHDRIFAAVSHLPHLAAFALVDDLAQRQDAVDYFEYAASGFRDFTRIAASSPEMWRDIALANRDALLAELAAYQGKLDTLRQALQAGDAATLDEIFSRASRARRNWNNDETH